jgi:AcrR family transcriptional regulator
MEGRDLKQACLREAMAAIRERGVEGLSLRDVARRLGVSHQAPYKHFASKDHLLAEVIRRCLRDFAEALRHSGLSASGTPLAAEDALRSLGQAYLAHASAHPLEYRLMFMTAWPEEARALGLSADARAAFDILRERLRAVRTYPSQSACNRDAMFVWSAVHGIATVLQSEAMQYLAFAEADATAAEAHGLALIDRALKNGAPWPDEPEPPSSRQS